MVKYAVALILFASSLPGSTIQYHWSASGSDVQLNSYDQWDMISIENGMPVFPNGYPDLPGVPRCYVIPQGTSVTGIEVSNIRTISLGRGFLPPPVMILPASGEVPHYPNYTEVCFAELSGSYPESPVAGFKTGTKTGFRLGSYSFVPFRYSRDSGELFLITSADITLVYESDSEAPVYSLTEGQVELAKRGLAAFVDNLEMLDILAPAQRAETDADTQVLIVGYEHHLTELNLLVSLHTTLGYTTEKVTVEWLEDNLEGYDLPERIRNHIKELYANNGLLFAVLVADLGDTVRFSKLRKPDSSERMNTFTDLYFSDLDGTWDANGNHFYGEEADGIDYYSDIYVGRYPTFITETAELNSMIEKAVQYNTAPVAGNWQERVLLMGAALSPDAPYGAWRFGSKACDSLASVIPDHWEIHRLYEGPTGNHPNHQLDIFNQGTSLAAYAAHGILKGFCWHYPWSEWPFILSRDTIPYMTNQGKLPWVIGRQCCNTGNIYFNGFAEMLVEHNGGGAIIAEASANTVYLQETQPCPSALLDIYFTHALFEHELHTAGITHGVSKDMFWADWNSSSLPRMAEWHMQQTSLLGDPCTVFIGAPHGEESDPSEELIVSIHPNPAHLTIGISFLADETSSLVIRVYDMLGRVVLVSNEDTPESGVQSVTLDSSCLASGFYVVQVTSGGLCDTAKCVVLH